VILIRIVVSVVFSVTGNIRCTANQPRKPHCEVDNDHCNTSQYQQDVVDKYTTVAAKGSIAKLLGSLIVPRIIVVGSLWRVSSEVSY